MAAQTTADAAALCRLMSNWTLTRGARTRGVGDTKDTTPGPRHHQQRHHETPHANHSMVNSHTIAPSQGCPFFASFDSNFRVPLRTGHQSDHSGLSHLDTLRRSNRLTGCRCKLLWHLQHELDLWCNSSQWHVCTDWKSRERSCSGWNQVGCMRSTCLKSQLGQHRCWPQLLRRPCHYFGRTPCRCHK